METLPFSFLPGKSAAPLLFPPWRASTVLSLFVPSPLFPLFHPSAREKVNSPWHIIVVLWPVVSFSRGQAGAGFSWLLKASGKTRNYRRGDESADPRWSSYTCVYYSRSWPDPDPSLSLSLGRSVFFCLPCHVVKTGFFFPSPENGRRRVTGRRRRKNEHSEKQKIRREFIKGVGEAGKNIL